MVVFKINKDRSPNSVFRVGASSKGFIRRQFIGGMYATDDKKEIEYLDKQNWCKRVDKNLSKTKMKKKDV